jgi:glycosyltransferase involved in cell wall biosynthesis
VDGTAAAPLLLADDGGGSALLWGVDLPGGDLPRSADGVPTANASACDCLCAARPACVAWTRRAADGRCWLKANPGPAQPAEAGLVSRRLPGRGNGDGDADADSHPSAEPRFLSLRERVYPRVDVWHGRCSAAEVRAAVAGGSIVVARLMTESAALRNTPGVLECAQAASEVWVPSAFHRAVFVAAGVRSAKVHVVPEAVDPVLFAPLPGGPPPLPAWPPRAPHEQEAAAAQAPRPAEESSSSSRRSPAAAEFVFLSVFKWEYRKGWDELLDAYWAAFGPRDPVVLRLRAWKPPWEPGSPDLDAEIDRYARSKRRPSPPPPPGLGDGPQHSSPLDALDRSLHRTRPRHELAKVEWLGSAKQPHPEALTRAQLLAEFRAAHAFVLPTRGEGWGLPVAEAMTLGLPTLVPAWSGPSAFATHATAYLIPLEAPDDDDDDDDDANRGGSVALDALGFAKPSVAGLTALLQRVVAESTDGRGVAQAKGAAARTHMALHFSPRAVGAQVLARLAALTNQSSETPTEDEAEGGRMACGRIPPESMCSDLFYEGG